MPKDTNSLKFNDPKPRGQITTGFLSKHLGTDQKFNEQNDGIGYRTEDGLLFGLYRNSLDKPSAYVAKEFLTDPLKLGPVNLKAGLLAGGVTGYGKPVMPLLMPELVGSAGDHSLALGMVPKIKGVTPAVLALQYRKRF